MSKIMNFKNYTPMTINIRDGGTVTEVPPSGVVAVVVEVAVESLVGGLPTTVLAAQAFGLPHPEAGVTVLVSGPARWRRLRRPEDRRSGGLGRLIGSNHPAPYPKGSGLFG